MTQDPTSPLSLLHQQMALERIGVDDSGHLYRLPGDNPDGIPRILTARLSNGQYIAYFRDDLPRPVAASLRKLAAEELHLQVSRVLSILGSNDPPWHGRSGLFLKRPPPTEFASVVEHDGRFVLEIAGRIVSEAWSSRSTEFAAELAVETQPDFQRRGFARQVCAAWAAEQIGAGRRAFYSHNIGNTASAAVAKSLGVMPFMENVNYD